MMNGGARYFMRREDYAPPTTSPDSRFRAFVIKCLHCDGARIKVMVTHDEGETVLLLICESCHRKEKVAV